MAAVIGALRADLSASVAKFEADMGRAAKAVQTFGKQAGKVSQNLEAAGQRMTLAITAPFIALAVTSAKAAAESNDAIAQVESRLKSMGSASGKTAEELEASAKQLQALSTFDDDDILRNVTNAMLTFGNVAGTVFDRAQRAAVDMATSLKSDLQSSSILVGKALNNPIKGLTALQRIGVAFTADQKKQITTLVESNRLYDAQAIILAELEREFKGAGEAARSAVPGADAIDSWREFQETVGAVFLEVLDRLEPFIVKVLDGFSALEPGMQTFIIAAAAVAAAIGPVLWALGAFVGAIANLAPLWAAFVEMFASASAAAGITSVGAAIAALVEVLALPIAAIGLAIAAMWEFRQVIFDAFGGVVAYFQSEVLPSFATLFASIGALFTELMSGPVGEFVRFVGWAMAEVVGFLVAAFGGAAGRAIAVFVDLMTTAINIVRDLVGIVNDLLRGDFAGAFEGAKDLVVNAMGGILEAIENIVPGAVAAAEAIATGFQEFLGTMLSNVLAGIEKRFPGLISVIEWAAKAAVGWAKHMFEGIKSWINDNLGPVIEWAKARIRELNALFAAISRRQASIKGEDGPAASAPAVAPAGPPPAPLGGGGGGGGGGGSGASEAEKKAKELKKATDTFRDALEDTEDAIDRAFDRRALPRSMQQANDLRKRIEEAGETAKAAGVDMDAFAASMATTQQRIRDLEIEGLAREAKEFAEDVRSLARDVVDLGGGLPPLADRLADIDDEFQDLRTEITEQIEANAALAEANTDAAAAMAVLEAQLGALDRAHEKATASATAQAAAEDRLKNLQAAADATDAEKAIRDLQQARGDNGPMTGGQQEMRAAQDALDQQRQAAAIELGRLEAERIEAETQGDVDQVARLDQQIALQTRLHDLVASTTAEQIIHADRVQDAWDTFESSAADGFAQLVTDWKGGLASLKKSFASLVADLLKAQAVKGINSLFSKFAGGFATGGTLAAGQWGIAGENGPEPIFAGAARMSVVSNEDASSGRGGWYVDARGAGPREVDELKRWAARMERDFDGRAVKATNNGIMRGQVQRPSFK